MIDIWHYDSPIGDIFIKLDDKFMEYVLIINDLEYDHYKNPNDACFDIVTYSTSCGAWDMLMLDDNIYPPQSLSEWTKL